MISSKDFTHNISYDRDVLHVRTNLSLSYSYHTGSDAYSLTESDIRRLNEIHLHRKLYEDIRVRLYNLEYLIKARDESKAIDAIQELIEDMEYE